MMRKFLLLPLLFLAGGLAAQTVPSGGVELSKVIPASADAAALGKYGNIPVSTYTGVPNISVPLYTVKSGDLSLPVSISYHAGGNKVEERASSVGLGWALNAGGAITRTIRGFEDEAEFGFLDTAHYAARVDSVIGNKGGKLSTANLNLYLNLMAVGTFDSEPDIYNFNFGGYSGRFVMDGYGNIMVMPQQKIKFTFSITYSFRTYISSFTAVTPDGNTYYFGVDGAGPDAVEFTGSNSSCNPTNPKYRATSWFLKRMVSPTGHTILFTYVQGNYSQTQAPSETKYQWNAFISPQQPSGGATAPPDEYCTPQNIFNTVKLSKVTFENGELNIVSNTARNDMGSNAKLTDSVVINGGGISKSYRFYYTNNSSTRLRLDSLIGRLEPAAGAPGYKKEKYSFAYSEDPWVNNQATLFSQDWWGYYNAKPGAVGGQYTLVPWALMPDPSGQPRMIRLEGATRAPDEASMLGGMLTRLTYPTGGYTTFNYEANQDYNADVDGTSPQYPPTPKITASSNDPGNIYYNYDANNGNPRHNMVMYSIASTGNPVTLSARGFRDASSTNAWFLARIWKMNSATDSTNYYTITNTDTTLYLPTGNYRINILDHNGTSGGLTYYFYAIWNNDNPGLVNNYIAGGLRIRSIADYDGVSGSPINLRTYTYLLPGQNKSSGWTDYRPSYAYNLIVNTGGGLNEFLYQNQYFVRRSVSNYPLSTTQGAVVGYSHVTEVLGAGGTGGVNEYFYDNAQTIPDLPFASGFPYPPAMSQDWHRGLLRKEINYRIKDDDTFQKVKEKVNAYNTSHIQFKIAIKAGFNPMPSHYTQSYPYYTGPVPSGDGALTEVTYTDGSDFYYLSSDTTRIFDLSTPSKFVQTSSSYQYDPVSFQINRVQTINSKNERVIQTVTYPNNYPYDPLLYPAGSMAGIAQLQGRNIYTYPVEEVTQKSDANGSNLRTIKAVLNIYKSNRAVRDSVYVLRTVAPLANFVNSSAGLNNILKDNRYQPLLSFDLYDAFGNVLQERRVGDAPRSYIWGYYTMVHVPSYPTAEVINADTASIAYANFESYYINGEGHWLFPRDSTSTDPTAPVGSKCFTVSSTKKIVRPALSTSKTYVVSFWSKTGAAITVTGGTVTNTANGETKNGWAYHEYQAAGTNKVTIGGTGLIDELRLYPTDAQMSTYAYTPLVGIAVKVDVRGNITYYRYDNVGRLTQVRDINNNILKDYQYTYKKQN